MNNKVAELRNIRNMTQEELASKAGVSRPHLSVIENGNVDVGGSLMLRLAAALDEKVEDVFFVNTVSCDEQKGA